MKPKIVLTEWFHPEVIGKELEPHARLQIVRERGKLAEALHDADGLITQVIDSIPAKLLAHGKKLRVVGIFGVGTNHIDVDYCDRNGITVVNTPDVLTRATAELTLALLLAAARRIPEGDILCRRNAFQGWRYDLLLGQLLRGRQAVLVGKGRIGRETGRLFRAIGLKTEWITSRDPEPAIARKLKRAQVLSLHVPLNTSTHHWLNSRRIALLPRDAIVLNTTRGPVVDEKALIRALQSRRIFAAGLDVFENEPDIPAALRKQPNVVLLPHLGSATRETRAAMARLVVSGVLGVLSGKRPSNAVNSRDKKARCTKRKYWITPNDQRGGT